MRSFFLTLGQFGKSNSEIKKVRYSTKSAKIQNFLGTDNSNFGAIFKIPKIPWKLQFWFRRENSNQLDSRIIYVRNWQKCLSVRLKLPLCVNYGAFHKSCLNIRESVRHKNCRFHVPFQKYVSSGIKDIEWKWKFELDPQFFHTKMSESFDHLVAFDDFKVFFVPVDFVDNSDSVHLIDFF